MSILHSSEDLRGFIATARTEMVEYQALGEGLLAECAEERMNRWLDQLAAPSGISAA